MRRAVSGSRWVALWRWRIGWGTQATAAVARVAALGVAVVVAGGVAGRAGGPGEPVGSLSCQHRRAVFAAHQGGPDGELGGRRQLRSGSGVASVAQPVKDLGAFPWARRLGTESEVSRDHTQWAATVRARLRTVQVPFRGRAYATRWRAPSTCARGPRRRPRAGERRGGISSPVRVVLGVATQPSGHRRANSARGQPLPPSAPGDLTPGTGRPTGRSIAGHTAHGPARPKRSGRTGER